jgi:FlaA1/EpsC-like NDP-sugar epimerase
VPLFTKQIAEGGPTPLILILFGDDYSRSFQLVLAGAMGGARSIFDMGKPVKIIEAKR